KNWAQDRINKRWLRSTTLHSPSRRSCRLKQITKRRVWRCGERPVQCLRITASPSPRQRAALWRKTIPAKQDKTRVLVADDQPHINEAVELLLSPNGIDVDCVRSPQLLMQALSERDYDVLLIDLNYTRDTTSGQEGL